MDHYFYQVGDNGELEYLGKFPYWITATRRIPESLTTWAAPHIRLWKVRKNRIEKIAWRDEDGDWELNDDYRYEHP